MAFAPITVPVKRLAVSITSSSSTFQLNNILGWDGVALTASDLGDRSWAVFMNESKTLMEIMRIDTSTIASASITITKRGLSFNGGDTEVSGNKRSWNANETLVFLGTNPPQLYNSFVDLYDAETVAGVKTFSSLPATTAGNPVADNDLARKAYVDSVVAGSYPANRVVIAGTAGETVAAGNLVYLKESDGRWWKADADLTATVDNISLGIAQGSGTAGNSISSGVLTYGLDTNQSGLTANSPAFAGNTAGAIVSTTPGTIEVALGYSTSTTSVFFEPRYSQQITEDQQDALAGTSGTPSSSNKYVTSADVSATSAASKIPRFDASGKLDVASMLAIGSQAQGDVIYASSASAFARLGPGTSGQFLKTQGAAANPIWSDISAVSKHTVDTTGVSYNNDATERTLVSVTITGGTLSTNNGVRVRMYFDNIAFYTTAQTFTLKFKYGGTTIGTATDTDFTNATSLVGCVEFVVFGNGATNAQVGNANGVLTAAGFFLSGSPSGLFNVYAAGSAAIDSTANQTLAITSQYGTANAGNSITLGRTSIEIIK